MIRRLLEESPKWWREICVGKNTEKHDMNKRLSHQKKSNKVVISQIGQIYLEEDEWSQDQIDLNTLDYRFTKIQENHSSDLVPPPKDGTYQTYEAWTSEKSPKEDRSVLPQKLLIKTCIGHNFHLTIEWGKSNTVEKLRKFFCLAIILT